MLRHVVGWIAPVVALIGLFVAQVIALQLGALIGIALVLLVGLAVGVAAEIHARLHPAFVAVEDRAAFTLWILPALIAHTVGLGIVAWQPDDLILASGLPLFGAAVVGLAIFAQDRELERSGDEDEAGGWAKQLLTLLIYLTAFGAFTVIYQTKERSLISATSIAIVAGLLSLVLLRSTAAPRRRTMLYALLTALTAGEVTWALNYWVVRELVGGAVLLLLFYVVVGLNEMILRGDLTRRLLAEYVGVGIVGFLLILSTGPWRP
ncbi:MAG: hypothetical protein M3O34_01440 [Chloroflexota bacterium]|nr:hypothetical protein [Chloroflexota bacterium]